VRASLHPVCAAALALAVGGAVPAPCQVPSQPTQGYVTVTGARLYYEEAGRGPAVVLLHGGFLDRRMWDREFAWMARDYRVVRYDIRGHGRSQADSVPYVDYEDLRALMDSLHIARAAVIGLSLGGRIVADFTLSYPDRVWALVLVGPGLSGFRFHGPEDSAYAADIRAASAQGWPAVYDAFVRGWCVGPYRERSDVAPAALALVDEMVAGSFQPRWRISRLGRELEPPSYARLREIRAPTLSVVGSLDMPNILEIVDSVATQVPGARRVVIPGAAHMVNMEKPAEFEAAVRPFLAERVR